MSGAADRTRTGRPARSRALARREWGRSFDSYSADARAARGGLSPWRERRVVEHPEACPTKHVSVAAAAGLSPNHAGTAFRITMSEPLHRRLVGAIPSAYGREALP